MAWYSSRFVFSFANALGAELFGALAWLSVLFVACCLDMLLLVFSICVRRVHGRRTNESAAQCATAAKHSQPTRAVFRVIFQWYVVVLSAVLCSAVLCCALLCSAGLHASFFVLIPLFCVLCSAKTSSDGPSVLFWCSLLPFVLFLWRCFCCLVFAWSTRLALSKFGTCCCCCFVLFLVLSGRVCSCVLYQRALQRRQRIARGHSPRALDVIGRSW